MDLAEGHVAAVLKSLEKDFQGWRAYNLGTGQGNSVLEVVSAYEKASGKKIPYEIVARRGLLHLKLRQFLFPRVGNEFLLYFFEGGDIASSFADCSRAEKELNWKAKKSIDDMCMSSGFLCCVFKIFIKVE